MGKKTLTRDRDQFIVRLPPGMRERIKAKADRLGLSMNEAIVTCLDLYFPAPRTFDQKVDELVELVALMKGSAGPHEGIELLIKEIEKTLRDVDAGIVSAPRNVRAEIRDQLIDLSERRAEEIKLGLGMPFLDPGGDLDDENAKS